VFGWFRKRSRKDELAPASAPEIAPAGPSQVDEQAHFGTNGEAPAMPGFAPMPEARPPFGAPQGDEAVAPAFGQPQAPVFGAPQQPGFADPFAPAPIDAEAPAPAEVEAPAQEKSSTAAPHEAPAEVEAQVAASDEELGEAPSAALVPAPSGLPAMPLNVQSPYAGFDAETPLDELPQLVDATAALTDAARDELTSLFTDMFGPRGRYRLEWRPDREEGDDAMFAQIMVADLVRRTQNTLGHVAMLELTGRDARELTAVERQEAIEQFLEGRPSLGELISHIVPERHDDESGDDDSHEGEAPAPINLHDKRKTA